MAYNGKERKPLLDGVEVKTSAGTFIVPPFNIKRSKQTVLARQTLRKGDVDSPEGIDALVTIATVALQANYPEIEEDWVSEEFSVVDLNSIFKGLMQANGVSGEAAAPASTGASPLSLVTKTGTES